MIERTNFALWQLMKIKMLPGQIHQSIKEIGKLKKANRGAKQKIQQQFLRVTDLGQETSFIVPVSSDDVIKLNAASCVEFQKTVIANIVRTNGLLKDNGRECIGEVLFSD